MQTRKSIVSFGEQYIDNLENTTKLMCDSDEYLNRSNTGLKSMLNWFCVVNITRPSPKHGSQVPILKNFCSHLIDNGTQKKRHLDTLCVSLPMIFRYLIDNMAESMGFDRNGNFSSAILRAAFTTKV